MSKIARILLLIVVFMGLAWSQNGWAVDLPSTATKDADLSAVALTKAKALLASQKETLTKQLETDTALGEEEKASVSTLLATVEQQLETLVNIDIYFVDESSAGEAFDEVAGFYKGKLNNFTELGNDELATLLDTPVEIMPQATKNSFEQMINEGSARAAAGTTNKTRVSVMTFYMNPDTFELIHQTTIVVATTK